MSNTRNILVVDDDQDLALSLAEQLALHEEFETHVAHSAAQAFAAVKSNHTDLVLLDVRLPDLTGIEVLDQLKKNGDAPSIIMITADPQLDGAIRLRVVMGRRQPVMATTITAELVIARIDRAIQ